MVISMYNKKRLLIFIPVALLVVGLLVSIALALSSETLDDRTQASSEVGMSLSPAAGKISADGLGIDLVINTHGKKVFGIDVTLEYTGSINYARLDQGNISNCTVKDVRQSSGEINLHCFIDPSKSYDGSDGIFAKVYFESTGTGSATINITEVSFSDSTGEIKFEGGSGNYEADFTESKIALDLDPQGGTISKQGVDIDLVINTYEDEVGGIDATLQYSGDIEYVNFKQGEVANCNVSETKSGENKLGFYCFVEPSKPAYKGSDDVFATLQFRSTGSGGGKIEITDVTFSVRDDRNEVKADGGKGEYLTSEEGGFQPPACGSLNKATFSYDTKVWPTKNFCLQGEVEPASPIFPSLGSTTSWKCISEGKDGESVSCSAQREQEPVKCGNLSGRTFTHSTANWPTGDFCIGGQPSPANPAFPALGASVTWQCVDTLGSLASCNASREQARETTPLPETSIFDSLGVVSGLGLLLAALTIFIYKGGKREESYSMRDKLSW